MEDHVFHWLVDQCHQLFVCDERIERLTAGDPCPLHQQHALFNRFLHFLPGLFGIFVEQTKSNNFSVTHF